MNTLLSLIESLHKRLVFRRRADVLAHELAGAVPAGARILDVGCGNGSISRAITALVPGATACGIDIHARPECLIECREYDGRTIPFAADSFDLCLVVDVLHHTAAIADTLAEIARVSGGRVLIKDHLCENRFDRLLLKVMDWVGNRPHGVVLPYNYLSRDQWRRCFEACGLRVVSWNERIVMYPQPLQRLCGDHLHFIALLEKA